VQRAGDADAGEGLACGILAADGHQAGHLLLGDVDLLAAPVGEGDVGYLVIADLGAGEGTLSMLLAQRAKRVIAVDSSEKMIEYGTALALRQGVETLEYRLGDLEAVPIEDGAVDLAFFSQSLHHAPHPARALAEAWRILRPGGRVAVLDLVKHRFEEARDLYADLWLGFAEAELEALLEQAGFDNAQTDLVHKEAEAPYFQTLLAVGDKPF
jgi:ubiquinone/menaquinone biosynthesis C-methylase UbiE